MKLFAVIVVGVLAIFGALYMAAPPRTAQSNVAEIEVELLSFNQPEQLYQLMVRNVQPELKVLGLILFLVLMVALFTVQGRLVRNMMQALYEATIERMMAQRPQTPVEVKNRQIRYSDGAPAYRRSLFRDD